MKEIQVTDILCHSVNCVFFTIVSTVTGTNCEDAPVHHYPALVSGYALGHPDITYLISIPVLPHLTCASQSSVLLLVHPSGIKSSKYIHLKRDNCSCHTAYSGKQAFRGDAETNNTS